MLPSKTVVGRASIELRRGDVTVALVSAVISVVLSGLLFEALTDREAESFGD